MQTTFAKLKIEEMNHTSTLPQHTKKSASQLASIFALLFILLFSFKPEKSNAQWTGVTTNVYGFAPGGTACILPDTVSMLVVGWMTGTAVPGDSCTLYVNWGDGTSSSLRVRDSSFVDGSFTHVYTIPGSFTQAATVTATSGVSNTWVATSPTTLTNTCAPITGHLYMDNNHNCVRDAGELGLVWAPIFLINNVTLDTSLYGYTDDSGFYSIVAPAGNYTILANPAYAYSLYWAASGPTPTGNASPSCPANGLYTLTVAVGGTYSQDFADTCAPLSTFDVWAGGCTYGAVPGDTTWVQVIEGHAWWYWGYSCTAFSNTVSLTLDPHLHYTGYATIPPTSVSGNTLTWNASTVGSYFYFYPRIKVYTDVSATMGSVVTCTVSATPTAYTDPNLTNNTQTFTRVVTSSWDPNEIAVCPQGVGTQGYIANNTQLVYNVHFQNTGTAAARNITVDDTLSANLDVRTLHMMNSSSPVEVYKDGNAVRFRFNNINLPDSISNPDSSIGSFTYSVLPKPGLAPGTQIYNSANIFFDYNPGVATNKVLNTINNNVGIAEVNNEMNAVVYPNPAGDKLFAHTDCKDNFMIMLTDMMGRTLYAGVGTNGIAEINTSRIASGIYLVKIADKSGAAQTIKVAIQH